MEPRLLRCCVVEVSAIAGSQETVQNLTCSPRTKPQGRVWGSLSTPTSLPVGLASPAT